MKKENKYRAIENSRLLKLADLATSTFLSNAGIPGAEALYNFSKLAINSAKQRLTDRDDERIAEFHAHLLLDNDELKEDILKSSLQLADYHSLLKACLDDIENEKVGCYGLLTQAIALGKIQSSLKRHHILTLKEISWEQLDLLARAYVLCKHDVRPDVGPGRFDAAKVLKKGSNEVQNIDINFLISRALANEDKITDVGSNLIESCFPQDLLTPEAFEYKTWLNAYYSIYTLGNIDLTYGASTMVHSYFRELGFKGGIGPAEGALDRFESNIYAGFFVIIYPSGHSLPDHRLENLRKTIANRPFVQVLISETPNLADEAVLEGEIIRTSSKELREKLNDIEKILARLLNENRAQTRKKPPQK